MARRGGLRVRWGIPVTPGGPCPLDLLLDWFSQNRDAYHQGEDLEFTLEELRQHLNDRGVACEVAQLFREIDTLREAAYDRTLHVELPTTLHPYRARLLYFLLTDGEHGDEIGERRGAAKRESEAGQRGGEDGRESQQASAQQTGSRLSWLDRAQTGGESVMSLLVSWLGQHYEAFVKASQEGRNQLLRPLCDQIRAVGHELCTVSKIDSKIKNLKSEAKAACEPSYHCSAAFQSNNAFFMELFGLSTTRRSHPGGAAEAADDDMRRPDANGAGDAEMSEVNENGDALDCEHTPEVEGVAVARANVSQTADVESVAVARVESRQTFEAGNKARKRNKFSWTEPSRTGGPSKMEILVPWLVSHYANDVKPGRGGIQPILEQLLVTMKEAGHDECTLAQIRTMINSLQREAIGNKQPSKIFASYDQILLKLFEESATREELERYMSSTSRSNDDDSEESMREGSNDNNANGEAVHEGTDGSNEAVHEGNNDSPSPDNELNDLFSTTDPNGGDAPGEARPAFSFRVDFFKYLDSSRTSAFTLMIGYMMRNRANYERAIDPQILEKLCSLLNARGFDCGSDDILKLFSKVRQVLRIPVDQPNPDNVPMYQRIERTLPAGMTRMVWRNYDTLMHLLFDASERQAMRKNPEIADRERRASSDRKRVGSCVAKQPKRKKQRCLSEQTTTRDNNSAMGEQSMLSVFISILRANPATVASTDHVAVARKLSGLMERAGQACTERVVGMMIQELRRDAEDALNHPNKPERRSQAFRANSGFIMETLGYGNQRGQNAIGTQALEGYLDFNVEMAEGTQHLNDRAEEPGTIDAAPVTDPDVSGVGGLIQPCGETTSQEHEDDAVIDTAPNAACPGQLVDRHSRHPLVDEFEESKTESNEDSQETEDDDNLETYMTRSPRFVSPTPVHQSVNVVGDLETASAEDRESHSSAEAHNADARTAENDLGDSENHSRSVLSAHENSSGDTEDSRLHSNSAAEESERALTTDNAMEVEEEVFETGNYRRGHDPAPQTEPNAPNSNTPEHEQRLATVVEDSQVRTEAAARVGTSAENRMKSEWPSMHNPMVIESDSELESQSLRASPAPPPRSSGLRLLRPDELQIRRHAVLCRKKLKEKSVSEADIDALLPKPEGTANYRLDKSAIDVRTVVGLKRAEMQGAGVPASEVNELLPLPDEASDGYRFTLQDIDLLTELVIERQDLRGQGIPEDEIDAYFPLPI